MQTRKGDVIVIGGGLEGALIARALHRAGQKVILLELGRPRDPETPYDRWVSSPFLYSATHWEWIQRSLPFWSEESALFFQDGAALAPRETPSWERLVQSCESHRVKGPALEGELFPEFKLDSQMGSIYLEKLPFLQVQGIAERIWLQLQRDGADPCADTEVRQIDWEHEWPTAVTRDTIYRARRLILTAPKLFHNEAHSFKQIWLQGQPQLEVRRPQQRPALWIHYAKAPLYLWPGPEHWGWVRLHEAEEGEERFLRGVPGRWLSCGLQDLATYELRVDRPALGFHPWRQDCLWMSRQGQQNWPWFPQLLEKVIDPQQSLQEFLPERPLESAGPRPA
ncbi:FAD-binding oxidoreductase [bacterium]|nr:FAD-binding oxidoreductase [bacterium]